MNKQTLNPAPQRKYAKKSLACLIASLGITGFGSDTYAEPGQVEEVIITARKVQENLQDTPVAVSAFSEEAMERRMITSTTDLSSVTPNLQFTSYSPLSGNNSAAQGNL